jgi:hypothetical protein
VGSKTGKSSLLRFAGLFNERPRFVRQISSFFARGIASQVGCEIDHDHHYAVKGF